MSVKDLVPVQKPLKPQRWGFLPTDEFWNLAFLHPVAIAVNFVGLIIFIGAIAFYAPALAWWQTGLAAVVFSQVWLGLFERCIRRRAARPPRALPPG